MNKRNIWLGASLLLISQWGNAQLKVNPVGQVGIGTNHPVVRLHVYGEGLIDSHAEPWESAFYTKVYNRNTSAYNLWNGYYGGEVFFVSGEGWMWSKEGAYVGTDSSLIQNRTTIRNPLESVMQLNGIRYSHYDAPGSHSDGNYRMGLIAQELKKVIPEAVKTMPDSLLAVSYADLVPLLVEAIKEQQDQISELQTVLSETQEEIATIKKRRWFKNKTVEE